MKKPKIYFEKYDDSVFGIVVYRGLVAIYFWKWSLLIDFATLVF